MKVRATVIVTVLITASLAASSANAPALVVAPTKGCATHTAKPAEPGVIAAEPGALAGKCVKLQGWLKDIGFYPTRAEAAAVDSLSIILLANLRIGLYLAPKTLAAAPQGPKLATVVGSVGGACSTLPAAVTAADPGYCHYTGVAYLAVPSIKLVK